MNKMRVSIAITNTRVSIMQLGQDLLYDDIKAKLTPLFRDRAVKWVLVCVQRMIGQFVLAKTEQISPILDIDIGESLGLFHAMKQVRDLELNNVVFELDSKHPVVDIVNRNNLDASNFDAIIRDCRHTFSSHFRNSHVEFIKRQNNEVVHNVARVTTFL